MADMLEEMAARAQPGDELGSVEGVSLKRTKTRSMVHMNGVELPERTRVYDRWGMSSEVPTAQLRYHLSKPAADGSGRAFFRRPPEGVGVRTPIDETCFWCEKRAGRRVKVFYDYDDLERHCEDLHPREWASKLRKEGQAASVNGVEGILKLLSNLSPAQRESLIGGK
jgi:hypothetical protein